MSIVFSYLSVLRFDAFSVLRNVLHCTLLHLGNRGDLEDQFRVVGKLICTFLGAVLLRFLPANTHCGSTNGQWRG